MQKEKTKNLPATAAKECLNPESALSLVKENLDDVSKNSKGQLSGFETEVKAYSYQKVLIWLISISPQPKGSNLRLALYVEVRTSRVKVEEIDIQHLKALDERKMVKINSSSFWYIQGRFSPLKYGNIMTRAQCEELWNKVKLTYRSKLASDGYVLYERPAPAIDRKTPLYIIAFRMIPYKVEALVVFPNLGKVTTHVYAKATWRKMLRKRGMGIVKGNMEITIAPDGFVTTKKMR